MGFFGTGNHAIESTQLGSVTNPTTQTLLAEIDFNSTMATARSGGEPYQVSWIVGLPATVATFLLDHALSTGTASTGIRNQTVVQVSSNQSGQFVTKHTIQPGDRLRVRVASSFTGSANAKIIADPIF